MEPSSLALAQMLSLAGLIAGTGEYAAILRRRAEGRRHAIENEIAAASGLQALVRIALADEARHEAH